MSMKSGLARRLLATFILTATSCMLFTGSLAKSRLPQCPSNTKVIWTNCQASMTWPNGEKYIGEYQDDMQNGQGIYTWPNGDKYVGQFQNNKMSGQGTYTKTDGRHYVGNFQEGKFNGQGTYVWPNGEKYVGEFRDMKSNGNGTYTWPDGHKYVGEFRDDNINGQGTMTMADGTRNTGIWENGELIKEKAYSSIPSKDQLPQSFSELQSKATGYFSASSFQILLGLLFAGAFAAGAVYIFRSAQPVTSAGTSTARKATEFVGTTDGLPSSEKEAASQTSQSDDLTKALERLEKLHEKGILTDAEFAQEKAVFFESDVKTGAPVNGIDS